jgi:hypothetical protein
MTLDTLITEARRRQAARDDTEQRRLADEAAARRQSWIDQLEREIARALPADLIAALDLAYATQDAYPQCYALFAYRGVDLWLSYGEQDRQREWHVMAPGKCNGRTIIEGADKPLFVDALVLAIGGLAGPASD